MFMVPFGSIATSICQAIRKCPDKIYDLIMCHPLRDLFHLVRDAGCIVDIALNIYMGVLM